MAMHVSTYWVRIRSAVEEIESISERAASRYWCQSQTDGREVRKLDNEVKRLAKLMFGLRKTLGRSR